VCGITVATAALVCALSIFNGFTEFSAKTFSAFDPQLQVTPVTGKVFEPTHEKLKIGEIQEVAFVSESLEENALAKFVDRQEVITMKGVSPEFVDLARINDLIIDGEFLLKEGDVEEGVVGAGLATFLGVRAGFLDPVELYVPRRNVNINLANPSTAFTPSQVYISGVFMLNQPKYDEQVLIMSIGQVRRLLNYETEVSSLDIKVKDGYDINRVQEKIKSALGENLVVKNRMQQQDEIYRMVNIEKWVTFLILGIILVIAIFNIVGSLTMLILEKDEDIRILRNMGAKNKMITRIFLFEGWLITFVGAMAGLVIGLTVCLLQQHYGLLKLGSDAGAFLIDSYPVSVEAMDVAIIFVTVNIIGFLAVNYPVNTLRKKLLQY
jgi:ABC-type lipoprotein release transport system permease subunit